MWANRPQSRTVQAQQDCLLAAELRMVDSKPWFLAIKRRGQKHSLISEENLTKTQPRQVGLRVIEKEISRKFFNDKLQTRVPENH